MGSSHNSLPVRSGKIRLCTHGLFVVGAKAAVFAKGNASNVGNYAVSRANCCLQTEWPWASLTLRGRAKSRRHVGGSLTCGRNNEGYRPCRIYSSSRV